MYERACYWQQWGHNVSVITCFPNFPEGRLYPGYKNRVREVFSMDGIRVVRVKTFIAPNAGTLFRIIDFCSYMFSAVLIGAFEKRPEVVVATSPQLLAAVAGWVLSIVHRVPFVMELSDLWPGSIVAVGAMKRNFVLSWLEKLELFLYARAKRIVALTNSFKQNLVSRGVEQGKIDVVMNGVDLTRYVPRRRDRECAANFGISPDEFVIAYVGTLGMAHDLQNVLHAAALTQRPDIRFLLVGPGAERDGLIVKAQELGLRNVSIAPPQPKEQMPAIWSICDVALVHLKNTTLFETVIPSKIFEAMAMGLPILLVSPKGEASAIIERERCGIVVPAGDPAALACAAVLLADDRSKAREFANQSQLAAPKYSRERQARDMITLLERAINKQNGASVVTSPYSALITRDATADSQGRMER